MRFFRIEPGLSVHVPSPALGEVGPEIAITEEAGVRSPLGQTLSVTIMATQGTNVAQGAPIACLRDAPDICFVAPMPGLVARIELLPGRKLHEIVLFRESAGDVLKHDISGVRSEANLRRLMQNAGVWPLLRRRPFGGMPHQDERPSAVVVMATDTRPLAPDPRRALANREEAFSRGLDALTCLTDGPVFVLGEREPRLFEPGLEAGRVKLVHSGRRHPSGSAGICVHALTPAGIGSPVWDVHAEDVAALGELLATGILPMQRLVRIGGSALSEERLVWTQPGADLRGLTHRVLKPGNSMLLSGSVLDGHVAHWLAPRDRQITALPRPKTKAKAHWLTAALTQSSLPGPAIPTAALDQAFGGALPATAFVRALASGNEEAAMKLGILSFLEEDVALADYVLGGEAKLKTLLRGMLDRIRTEFAA